MSERAIAVDLTDSELRLIKANIAYAIENCPVDGGIMTEDGQFSTKDYYDHLQEKVTAIPVKSANKIDVDSVELKFFIATAEYALDNCPVEGKIMMDDGQFSSKQIFEDLLEKLRSYESKPIAAPQITGQEKN